MLLTAKQITLGSFRQNFKNLCQDKTTTGLESLYELPFSDGRGRVLYTFGVKHKTVDKYTMQAQGGANGPLPLCFTIMIRMIFVVILPVCPITGTEV